ncbi:DNA-dependent ATPase protein rad54, partial [Massospora cicadina]
TMPLMEPPIGSKRVSIISTTMDTLSAAWRRRAEQLSAPARSSVLFERYGVCDRRSIGIGATATVRLAHKAEPVKGERLYAIKAFRSRRRDETPKQYLKRLTGEFCIGSSLVHPHVISILDLVQDERDGWCQVMEYCPGGDLFALINELSPTRAASLFSQLLAGVAYLHRTGVVHRDLKPENLLLDAQGVLKVSDFGSAEVFRQPWAPEKVYPSYGPSGSHPYIAPECFKPQDFDGRPCDLWSCGIIFVYMLARALPWKVARSFIDPPTLFFPFNSLHDVNFEAYRNTLLLPHALPEIDGISPLPLILDLLSISPERRPTAAHALEHRLFSLTPSNN